MFEEELIPETEYIRRVAKNPVLGRPVAHETRSISKRRWYGFGRPPSRAFAVRI